MSVSATNTNLSYFEYVRSSSDGSGISKINESKFQNDEKTYLKYSSRDKQNIKVTEKPDKNETTKDYNIHLQQNTPASKLLKILKSFNETNKTNSKITNIENDYASFTEINESVEETHNHVSSDEIGYYIVIDDPKPIKNVKKIKRPIDNWRKRINNTYHLGFMKEPGTLVNAVI